MAKLSIITVPDARLRRTSQPVAGLTAEYEELALNLLETIENTGVGISAVQAGVLVRLVVINLTPWGRPKTYTMFNPQVLKLSEEKSEVPEACLSIPETLGSGNKIKIIRPKFVRVGYLNLSGNMVEEDLDDFGSRVFQHEYDHLDGKLITDYLPQAQSGPAQIAC